MLSALFCGALCTARYRRCKWLHILTTLMAVSFSWPSEAADGSIFPSVIGASAGTADVLAFRSNKRYLRHLQMWRVLSLLCYVAGLPVLIPRTHWGHIFEQVCVWLTKSDQLSITKICTWVFNKIQILSIHLECGCSHHLTWFWLYVGKKTIPVQVQCHHSSILSYQNSHLNLPAAWRCIDWPAYAWRASFSSFIKAVGHSQTLNSLGLPHPSGLVAVCWWVE